MSAPNPKTMNTAQHIPIASASAALRRIQPVTIQLWARCRFVLTLSALALLVQGVTIISPGPTTLFFITAQHNGGPVADLFSCCICAGRTRRDWRPATGLLGVDGAGAAALLRWRRRRQQQRLPGAVGAAGLRGDGGSRRQQETQDHVGGVLLPVIDRTNGISRTVVSPCRLYYAFYLTCNGGCFRA
jgi:hypothetical protein